MTKNAIHALARHVAQKWGKKGIRANVICPGLVLTEAAQMHLTDEYREAGLKAIPHTPPRQGGGYRCGRDLPRLGRRRMGQRTGLARQRRHAQA